MTGIDQCQRKLLFPPRFVPYLEKHRIFELFHELTELLIHERPKDHVKFIRDKLPCAAKRRDKPRIVFLSPPSFDRTKFAEEVAKRLNILAISRLYLEMKERERQMLLRMQKEPKPPSYMSGEEEEESCICPGEDYGDYIYRFGEIRPENPEEEYVYDLSVKSSKELKAGEEEKVEPEEDLDPCKGFRVCPCKKPALPDIPEKDETELDDIDDEKLVVNQEQNVPDSAPEDEINREEYDKFKDETTIDTNAMKPISTTESSSCVCESSEGLKINFGVLATCEYSERGWILIDVPENAEEAELISEQGAVPTHALRIVTGSEEENEREYKYMTTDWMNIYRSIPVKTVYVNGRSMSKVADCAASLVKVMPHRHAPMLPRIVLIGSRGSGANTQARLLSEKYGLVHVKFQEEMARIILNTDKFSQMYKTQLKTRPDPELEAVLLEKTLLSTKCRKRGWVITGYPTNSDQMRMMDLMATPPNRIIFIDVSAKECFVRLYYRKVDWVNGKEYRIPTIEPFGLDGQRPVGIDPDVKERLLQHPKNDKRKIIRDIEEYFEEKEDMMKYCGKTASRIDGNKTVENVFEQIEEILASPSPAAPPRNPLSISCGIDEAYEKMKKLRMDTGININNLVINPPDPLFKL